MIIAPDAETDLRTIYQYLRKYAPQAAKTWLSGLRSNRGTYRILFVILEGEVFVVHVRHGSRLPLEPGEEG